MGITVVVGVASGTGIIDVTDETVVTPTHFIQAVFVDAKLDFSFLL